MRRELVDDYTLVVDQPGRLAIGLKNDFRQGETMTDLMNPVLLSQ
jgi:hypothetical protein